MDRLFFLSVAILAALIGVRLNLGYIGFAILIGTAIPLFSLLVRDGEIFSSTAAGYVLLGIGVALLLVAYAVAVYYGITFEALDNDRTFPKLVRRLPYYGIASIAAGVSSIAISGFRQR